MYMIEEYYLKKNKEFKKTPRLSRMIMNKQNYRVMILV